VFKVKDISLPVILPMMYQPHIEMAFLLFKEKAIPIINELGMITNVPDIVTD